MELGEDEDVRERDDVKLRRKNLGTTDEKKKKRLLPSVTLCVLCVLSICLPGRTFILWKPHLKLLIIIIIIHVTFVCISKCVVYIVHLFFIHFFKFSRNCF